MSNFSRPLAQDILLLAKSGYQTQASDTSIEAEVIQFSLWQRMGLNKRLALASATSKSCKQLTLSSLKKRHPQLPQSSLKREFVKATLGEEFTHILTLLETGLVIEDPIWLAAKIGKILDELSIPYYVGGSIASSAHGEPRSTLDADIAVSIGEDRARLLIEAMQPEFYISSTSVAEALSGRMTTFNVIHLETSIKADIYLIRLNNEYERSQLARRQRYSSDDRPELNFYICTPEDIVLQKLVWYRIGRRQSDKQWRDILGVLKLQGENLDLAYLQHWAERLNLTQLLTQARTEAGLTKLEEP